MQPVSCRSFKDSTGACRNLRRRAPLRDKAKNVELWFKGGRKYTTSLDGVPEFQRGISSFLEALCEFAAADQRQEVLRRPQSRRRCSGSRAFQTDFAEMQRSRAEVGVGRSVFVQAAYRRIAEQHTTTAVRLQTMFVWINDNRIRFAEPGKTAPRVLCQVFG